MLDEINSKISEYKKNNDIHRYRLILDASDIFVNRLSNGVNTKEELDLGIELVRNLVSLSYISNIPQYEHNYDLHNEILISKIKVFKLCIPQSHYRLRGLTELILGMKEDSVK